MAALQRTLVSEATHLAWYWLSSRPFVLLD
jgi:hypothetical protein